MGNIDREVARFGSAQAGAVSRAQLLDSGVSPSAITRAVRASRLGVASRGVLVVMGSPELPLREFWVAHLAAGTTSAVSHGSAGRHWGVDGVLRCRATVTVVHGSSPTGGSIIVHRSRHLADEDVVTIGGLRFTTPARTIVDLAADYGAARLGTVLDSAHFGRIVGYEAVGSALLRIGGKGRRGSRRLADLLDERCGGDSLAASVLERKLRDVLDLAGVIGAVRQHPLPSLGETTGTVDLYLPDARLIIEADGRRWHSRQADMKRDRDRDFAAAQVGVQTLRFLHEHLTCDAAGCATGLRRVVDARVLGAIASGG